LPGRTGHSTARIEEIRNARQLSRRLLLSDYVSRYTFSLHKGTEGLRLLPTRTDGKKNTNPHAMKWKEGRVNLESVLLDAQKPLREKFEANLTGSMKTGLYAELVWFNPIQNKFQVYMYPLAGHTLFHQINEEDQFDEAYKQQSMNILSCADEAEQRGLNGSGWEYVRCNRVDLLTFPLTPTTGGKDMITPPILAAKKTATVNVRNGLEKCFKYAVLASRYYAGLAAGVNANPNAPPSPAYHYLKVINHFTGSKDHDRTLLCEAKTYDLLDAAPQSFDANPKYNWEGVGLPAARADIDRFEENNPWEIIDCYWYNEDGQKPHYGEWRINKAHTIEDRKTKTVTRLLMIGDRNLNAQERQTALIKEWALSGKPDKKARKGHFPEDFDPYDQPELNNDSDSDCEDDDCERDVGAPIEDNNHFIWLRNVKAMTGDTFTHNVYACPYCLRTIQDRKGRNQIQTHLDMHKQYEFDGRYRLPEPGSPDSVLREGRRPFQPSLRYKYHLKLPNAIYCDIESILIAILSEVKGHTTKTHEHEPLSWGMAIVDADHNVLEYISECGSDPVALMHSFHRRLDMEAGECKAVQKEAYNKIVMTDAAEQAYKAATQCHICHGREHSGFTWLTSNEKRLMDSFWEAWRAAKKDKKTLTRKNWMKTLDPATTKRAEKLFEKDKWTICRDHDPTKLEDNFRGAAHSHCNAQFTTLRQPIPVFFHNLKGYDAHFIMKYMLVDDQRKVNVIATSSEKYQAIRKGKWEIKDSLAYTVKSIDACMEVMRKNPGKLKALRAFVEDRIPGARGVPDQKDRAFELLCQKGAYPYEACDSFEFLKQTELPAREFFGGGELSKDHNDSGVQSMEEVEEEKDRAYALAKQVWEVFECKTMRDYHDIYLACDIFQLTDIMESIREESLADSAADLDPAWFYGVPSLSYARFFAFREKQWKQGEDVVELQLLTDQSMLDFVLKMRRGGLVNVHKRLAYANHPRMGPDRYDPRKPINQIIYIDANNLYGWAMMQCLPSGNFRWFEGDKDLLLKNIRLLGDDDATGYIFEIERLVAPRSAHRRLDSMPGVPELKESDPGEHMKPFKPEMAFKKLICDLKDKNNIGLHYRYLKMLLDLGWEAHGVSRVLAFDQSEWLAPMIQHNTEKRQACSKADNEVGKEFFKLSNNSLFGKLIEDALKRMKLETVFTATHFRRLYSSPRFENFIEFSDSFFGVNMKPGEVNMTTLAPAGVSVLDLSKLRMHQMWHQVLKEKYGSSVELLYMDTDSLIVQLYADEDRRPGGPAEELQDRPHHDFYSDIARGDAFSREFDRGGFSKGSGLKCMDLDKVPGKFSVEYPEFVIEAFAAPKAKSYACRLLYNPDLVTGEPLGGVQPQNSEVLKKLEKSLKRTNAFERDADGLRVRRTDTNSWELKKAKSICSTVARNQMTFEEYEGVIQGQGEVRKTMAGLMSHKHRVYTENVSKRAFGYYDDKRDVLGEHTDEWGQLQPAGVFTHAHGFDPLVL
jgi:hypothetical protein